MFSIGTYILESMPFYYKSDQKEHWYVRYKRCMCKECGVSRAMAASQRPSLWSFWGQLLSCESLVSLRWNQELNKPTRFGASVWQWPLLVILTSSAWLIFDDDDVDAVAMVESSSFVDSPWKSAAISRNSFRVASRDSTCSGPSKADLLGADGWWSSWWSCFSTPSWMACSNIASCRTSRFRVGGNSALLGGAKATSCNADKFCNVAATSSATSRSSSWRMYSASWSAAWAPYVIAEERRKVSACQQCQLINSVRKLHRHVC